MPVIVTAEGSRAPDEMRATGPSSSTLDAVAMNALGGFYDVVADDWVIDVDVLIAAGIVPTQSFLASEGLVNDIDTLTREQLQRLLLWQDSGPVITTTNAHNSSRDQRSSSADATCVLPPAAIGSRQPHAPLNDPLSEPPPNPLRPETSSTTSGSDAGNALQNRLDELVQLHQHRIETVQHAHLDVLQSFEEANTERRPSVSSRTLNIKTTQPHLLRRRVSTARPTDIERTPNSDTSAGNSKRSSISARRPSTCVAASKGLETKLTQHHCVRQSSLLDVMHAKRVKHSPLDDFSPLSEMTSSPRAAVDGASFRSRSTSAVGSPNTTAAAVPSPMTGRCAAGKPSPHQDGPIHPRDHRAPLEHPEPATDPYSKPVVASKDDEPVRVVFLPNERGEQVKHFLIRATSPPISTPATSPTSEAPPTLVRPKDSETSPSRRAHLAVWCTTTSKLAEEAPANILRDTDEEASTSFVVAEMRQRNAARCIQTHMRLWITSMRVRAVALLQNVGRAFLVRRELSRIPIAIRGAANRLIRVVPRAANMLMLLQRTGRGYYHRRITGEYFFALTESRIINDFARACALTRVGTSRLVPGCASMEKLRLRTKGWTMLPSEEPRTAFDVDDVSMSIS